MILGLDNFNYSVRDTIKTGLKELISKKTGLKKVLFFAPQDLFDTKDEEAICLVKWYTFSGEEARKFEREIEAFFSDLGLKVSVQATEP